jgi:hypothetical protein
VWLTKKGPPWNGPAGCSGPLADWGSMRRYSERQLCGRILRTCSGGFLCCIAICFQILAAMVSWSSCPNAVPNSSRSRIERRPTLVRLPVPRSPLPQAIACSRWQFTMRGFYYELRSSLVIRGGTGVRDTEQKRRPIWAVVWHLHFRPQAEEILLFGRHKNENEKCRNASLAVESFHKGASHPQSNNDQSEHE